MSSELEKLLNDLRNAAASLKLVILGYGMPLDTSEFDKAVKAIEGAAKPVEKPAEKPEK